MTNDAINWLKKIFYNYYGLHLEIVYERTQAFIFLKGEKGKIIFSPINKDFQEFNAKLPFTVWNARNEGWKTKINQILPVPGKDKIILPLIKKNGDDFIIQYDVLGLIYWMLNRIEEIGASNLDKHERFCATNSHAFKHNYLSRPIIDEWLDILGQVFKKKWNHLKIKRSKFKIIVSHDVDTPVKYETKNWPFLTKLILSDILKKFNFKSPYLALISKINNTNQFSSFDPYNTFDWLMSTSEKNRLKSTFFFIAMNENKEFDGDYKINDTKILNLIKSIYKRGHNIGLHASYNSTKNIGQIALEAKILKQELKKIDIKQKFLGIRNHYLRWQTPNTLNEIEKANLTYDTSLGYADYPGFRCGTCHPFEAFDPINQKPLKLKIYPLIAMECSIISKDYMGLGYSNEALKVFEKLKENCKRVNGIFTLLWHNSSFPNKNARNIYEKILELNDN